ncbi:glutamate 5-kinase [Saccharobesus litoralis]|uniref:Glutamate 5-kinase n=1 Tax=Saccharobesus litoralis TaxID=2172099 RepID=A0A2S0VR19_9ALTE|nr:glutamate 5-kinase [Saccharobesus litoralis]AWB66644.1 glutamate 5-kinase [Saccharobesus litoralis]
MASVDWHRAVIKVGSALISPNGDGCSGQYLLPIARYISECRQQGKEVILVSSGSVAAGRSLIAHGDTPLLAEKQAMAAVGQTLMMANWQRFFDFPCAQILVTHGDLADRERYLNIQNTIRTLLDNGILPIVNENDSVTTKELKVGDNDNLGALVALVSSADMLMICSDIDGLFNKDPRSNPDATLIPVVEKVDESIYSLAGGTSNKLATGGMRTKIEAAEKATVEGINTLIVNGTKSRVFDDLLAEVDTGTLFKRQASPKKARKHWLQHGLKSKGQIVVDAGAQSALQKKGASLLSIGVTAVTGDFHKGDALEIVSLDGKLIAKGIGQYHSNELQQIKGQQSHKIIDILGYCPSDVVIHRDDLVVL